MSVLEKKDQETIDELKEWLDKPNCKDFYFNQANNKINDKLNEAKIPKSIVTSYDNLLNNWYSKNFVYELLTKHATSYKTDAVATGYYTMIISDKLADQYMNQNPPHLPFDNIGYWLANCLSQKRYTESETLLKIINRGLNSNFIKGGLSFKTAAWFVIEIANNGYKNTFDYSKCNYPKDMGVYQEALNNWNTNDLNLLDNIVSKLCEYHLNQASYGDISDDAGYNDPIFLQFSKAAWFVYAFEILTWLSIRVMVGLQNPEKFTHPLMDLELNKLTNESDSFPKNELSELFEKVMVRLDS